MSNLSFKCFKIVNFIICVAHFKWFIRKKFWILPKKYLIWSFKSNFFVRFSFSFFHIYRIKIRFPNIVGVQPEEKHADFFLNKWNTKLCALPSFIFPFANKVLLDMSLSSPSAWLSFDQTVHGEQYIQHFRQLPPKGIINFEIKILDILDKGKGTLYCFNCKDIYEKLS